VFGGKGSRRVGQGSEPKGYLITITFSVLSEILAARVVLRPHAYWQFGPDSFDPKLAILGLFVLNVLALIRTHKDRFAQNSVSFVRPHCGWDLPTQGG
jgi:hypothetical protein